MPDPATPPEPKPIVDLDAAKLGVLLYRSGSGTYVMVIDWRDNAHECFRAFGQHGRGSQQAKHVDWDKLPTEARDYFGAHLAANIDGKGGAA